MVGRTVFRPILGLCLSDGLRCARIPSPLHPLDETKPWECTRRAMPPLQSYDPILIGFVEGKGPVQLHLQAAQDEHGRLPSDFGLLSDVKNRRARRALNLPVGLAVLDLLRDGNGLPELLAQFYERWGRDFRKEFGVDIARFHRFNDPWTLRQIVEENRAGLADCLAVDVLTYLHVNAFVPLSTLRSIPADRFPEKVKEILAKRHRNPAHEGERGRIAQALALLHARDHLGTITRLLGTDLHRWAKERLATHADEVARILWEVSRHVPVAGVDRLSFVRGRDVEVTFAPRDGSFLALGKEVGDCTADKLFRQVDRDVENIYWTVFSWFLDRNYQILKVHYDGEFVMKVHLLPVLAATRDGGEVFLAVDAIETTPVFREDTRVGHPDLLEKKEYIFARTVEEVQRLAQAMGIEHVYAERFSNTAWVRRELERFPEVYLHIGDIQKIDELEDVFELAKRICAAAGRERPSSIFMELQMKNTFLLQGTATVRGVKVFAMLAGDARLGIPMRRVFGV